MSVYALSPRSGGVIGTIGPIGGKGVWSLRERRLLAQDFYDDVSLYLKMNGADGSTTFFDSSPLGHTVTAHSSVAISGSVGKFGGSALFNANGKRLTVPAGSAFAYGTGDFTVEAWVYRTASADGYWFTQTVSGTNYFVCGTSSTGRVFFVGAASGGGSGIDGPADTLAPLNEWAHVAIVRSAGSVTVFCNGVPGSSSSSGPAALNYTDTTRVPTVGRYTHADTNRFQGYIDDLRITKGRARYTASFTPPTRAFLP